MAQITTLVCDVDGTSENVTTVRFALQGKAFELDLSAKSLKKLQDVLAPFIEKAHTPGDAKPAKRAATRTSAIAKPEYDTEALKAWAQPLGLWTGKRPKGDVVERFLQETAQ